MRHFNILSGVVASVLSVSLVSALTLAATPASAQTSPSTYAFPAENSVEEADLCTAVYFVLADTLEDVMEDEEYDSVIQDASFWEVRAMSMRNLTKDEYRKQYGDAAYNRSVDVSTEEYIAQIDHCDGRSEVLFPLD